MINSFPALSDTTYRIESQIGSGGGGVVYKAWHMRLQKHVVIKELKRGSINDLETQRNEVEALKNVKSQYLPQVFDFITENDRIYTVMEFIEGESLDKPLERGQGFSQDQIVKWSIQLTSALEAIHKQKIFHRDIKPANIMLLPSGDVCLIDFNAALVSGNDVKIISRSLGYASPEQYEIYERFKNTQNTTAHHESSNINTRPFERHIKPFVQEGETTQVLENDEGTQLLNNDETEIIDEDNGTEWLGNEEPKSDNDQTGRLDVKKTRPTTSPEMDGIDWGSSDIYSLGATLYHLLTGIKPAQNAMEVVPIQSTACSPAVSEIIAKAMDPNPQLRYQSAEEMLYAFEHLRENDPRVKRQRRIKRALIALFILVFCTGGFVGFVGLKQKEGLQRAYALAEYSLNALSSGDVILALETALQALPENRNILTPPSTAQAQNALTKALGVYDLSHGFKAHKTVKLPSEPFCVEISPDGKTAAAIYTYELALFDTDTAEILSVFPVESSALSEVKYVNEDTIIYAGEEGVKAYNIKNQQELWAGKKATKLSVSTDGHIVAAIYKDETFATIYETATGQVIQTIHFDGKYQKVVINDSFANPNNNIFALNIDGSILGVSFGDGSLWLYNLKDRELDAELFSASDYTHFEGGFFEQYFAFSATKQGNSVFAVVDVARLEQTGGFESQSAFGVQTDEDGICVQTENLLVKLHPVTGDQIALVNTSENIVGYAQSQEYTMINTGKECLFFDGTANLISRWQREDSSDFIKLANGTAVIASLDTPEIQIMKLENHPEADVFSYDPSYEHDEARFSADRKTVMLFSFDHFRLYQVEGTLITQVDIPNADEVYDQQYYRDENGSRLEVMYNDGTALGYSAQDGSLIYARVMDEVIDPDYEEFFTDFLRIESPLHGTPIAYDQKTGKLVKALEQDAYLTYVTQVGEYIITEYVTAEGERYGLLLNDKCETLAELPHLCDIIGDELFFDYSSGDLRKSQVYHLNELTGLAREQINNEGGEL